MLTDNEIKRVTEDALGFKAWAQALEEIICSSETPITIGVYGIWGSGKTSLMRMTEDLLKEKDVVRTVWFDAWKFDKTHDLRVALIDTVLRRIQNDENINESLKMEVGNLLKRVNWLGLGKAAISSLLPLSSLASHVMDSLVESFLKKPEDIPEKTLELIGEFEGEFKDLIREYIGYQGRLVVFIDDLDRCIPEKAIDVLESMKLFLHVRGSVFVIGADKIVIEDGITQKYGEKSENWGKSYLDKIIQIPINLPPLRKDIITERFIWGLGIPDEIKKHASIIAEVGDNPRLIKRLLNRFEVQRILADKKKLKIENNVMAKLVVIEFRWPEFYIDLISVYSETGTNLARILGEISKGADIEREKRLEEWKFLKKYLDDRRLMKYLLKDEPLLADINLDHYVYMGLSTTELTKSAENYFNIAYSFYEKGEYVAAVENYDKAIELDPKNEKAWFNKGVALEKLGEYEAIDCYREVTNLNPRNAKAWSSMGRMLIVYSIEEGGAFPFEAMEYLDIATNLNPKDEKAWFYKGLILDIEGEGFHLNAKNSRSRHDEVPLPEEAVESYEKAIRCYDRATDLNPRYFQAWLSKGNTYETLQEHDEAIKCFEKITEFDPMNEEEWFDKGYVLYVMGENKKGSDKGVPTLNEALECFERVIELNPENEAAYRWKDILLEKLGQKGKTKK